MYITIGKNKKPYYPDDWQFVAYQFLNIHIEDIEMEGKPYCLRNSQEITLTNIDKYGNQTKYWQLPYNEHIKPTVGEVYIGYKKKDGSNIKEKIIILPSVLKIDEFEQMAKQIANIVFNCHSFTYADFSQQVQQGSSLTDGERIGANTDTKQGSKFEQLLEKLPQFLEILEGNLQTIERNPALAMRAVKKEGDISKSNKPKDLLMRKLQPNKKRTLTYDKVYDEFSPENKWLGYLVYETLPRLVNNFLNGYVNQKKDSELEQQDKDKINVLLEDVERIQSKIKTIQSNSFAKKFDLKIKAPPSITTKLMKSKGYSAILQAYYKIFDENFLKAFQQYQETITAYSSGYVDNLSNIYEHWCLVILYENLLKLGFKPLSDSDRLENNITLADDNLIIPSQSVFRLSKPFAQYDNFVPISEKNITITLYYEPSIPKKQNNGHSYKPDIKIDIVAPKRCYGLESFSLILDAKFKEYTRRYRSDYNSLVVSCLNKSDGEKFKVVRDKMIMLSDIIGASMFKYHADVNSPPDMSVILHPNVGDEFNWRGEFSLEEFLRDNNHLTNDSILMLKRLVREALGLDTERYIVNRVLHKFGSLTLRPNSLAKDIRRLFTIIFHYHMGLTSLCLHCGRELYEEMEFLVNCDERHVASDVGKSMHQKQLENGYSWKNTDPSTRFHAKCQDCNTQWRVSFCANNGSEVRHTHTPSNNNRIVKVGVNDSNDNIGYMPIHDRLNDITFCPSCGSGKIPNSDERTTRHEQMAEN
ncbi:MULTISPECIES: hypothetical protein [unclassified Moraxella]|uniref:hypothetical protein n=1 Tax=unclassified Moraxella TaxID=2685852 RepID=UPI003AF78960